MLGCNGTVLKAEGKKLRGRFLNESPGRATKELVNARTWRGQELRFASRVVVDGGNKGFAMNCLKVVF